jgi:hypothetical protein
MEPNPALPFFIIVPDIPLNDLLYVIIGLQSMQFGVLLAIAFVLDIKKLIFYIFQWIWHFIFGENGLLWLILDYSFYWVNWILVQLTNALGTKDLLPSYSASINEALLMCSGFDQFVPLSDLVGLLNVFLGFLMLFITIKFILKLIPAIG